MPELTEGTVADCFYRRNFHRFATIIPSCYPLGWFECDLLAVTRANFFCEFEIKLSAADFRADAGKGGRLSPKKHERLASGDPHGPSRFWFIVPEGMVDMAEIPPFAGLYHILQDKRFMVFKEVRKAPRLHRTPMSGAVLDVLRKNICFRYWTLRLHLRELSE